MKKKPDAPWKTIGRYEIRRELGRGTMGVVYEAWDPVLGRTVAVKTIGLALAAPAADREAYEKRFLTEARIAARLSDPGIVVVHDVARDAESGLLYIALEYLIGETLAERIAGGKPMDWQEALRITGRVAQALHHAHAEGVIHRDIKPANIMVLRSGEPKIMDFGIARLDTSQLTNPGELFGTPLYMAPEQALGQPVDARADLFSLGTILYTLVTGQSPFQAQSLPGILARVAHQDPPPPSESTSRLPPDVDYIVARAMAKAPADRYPDGNTLADDAEDVVDGRPARHRSEWSPPRSAERTMVSKRPAFAAPVASASLPSLDSFETVPPAAAPVAGASVRVPTIPPTPRQAVERRRLRADVTALLMAALLAVAAAYFHLNPGDWEFWRKVAGGGSAGTVEASPAADATPEPGESPADHATPPAPDALPAAVVSPASGTTEPSPAAASSPGAGSSPIAAASPAAHVEAPSPTPSAAAIDPAAGDPSIRASAPPAAASTGGETAEPPPGTRPPEKPGTTPPKKPAGPGQLVIELEHQLDGGTLEVWVDDDRVFKDKLERRSSRRVLTYEGRKGSAPAALRLSPGSHSIRVRVQSGKTSRTARTTAAFKAGVTRRLELKVTRRVAVTLTWR